MNHRNRNEVYFYNKGRLIELAMKRYGRKTRTYIEEYMDSRGTTNLKATLVWMIMMICVYIPKIFEIGGRTTSLT
jgi:hypothetical protein